MTYEITRENEKFVLRLDGTGIYTFDSIEEATTELDRRVKKQTEAAMKASTLTIDQVTLLLASVLSGESADAAARAVGKIISSREAEVIEILMRAARNAGMRWSFRSSEKALDRVYKILGSENPGTGYSWHTGKHPIQLMISN